MFFAVSLIVVFLAIFYIALFSWFTKGWICLKQYGSQPVNEGRPSFTVIVPARNEEKNIISCLDSLTSQQYPADKFEIIVADDHSEDRTASVVMEYMGRNPGSRIQLLQMNEFQDHTTKVAYKKKAIAKAIEKARHYWIITTDADCTRNKNWMSAIASFIIEQDPVLVSAPVIYRYNGTFFQKAQALEFMGLIGIGGASIAQGSPNLCNGANLIYKKSAYLETGGFAGIDGLASGDDELLMHKIAAKYPGKVKFLKAIAAAVHTDPSKTLREFIEQRKRWVSKSQHYAKKQITIILIAAYLFNVSIVISLLAALFEPKCLLVFILLILVKLVPEYIFLNKVTKSFGQHDLMNVFLPASLSHILYTLFIGIYGNLGQYHWKGRKVK